MTTIQSFWNGWKNIFKISPPKIQKIDFFAKKWRKMTKNQKIFEKLFLVGIDLEWSKTCVKSKISIWKIFPLNFFSGTAVFSKNWWPKNRKVFEKKFFLVGIGLEWSKTCFEMKISILKIFSRWKLFFRDTAVFSKKWWSKKENFSIKIFWSESIWNGPKRVLKRKYRFWKKNSGTSQFFRKMGIMGQMTTENEINENWSPT